MRMLRFLVLYAAVGLGANTASADTGALIALADGDLAKLQFHAEPRAVTQVTFKDSVGGPVSLSDYEGNYVLLNFWALWCAPCREEMPALNALDKKFEGQNFEVVTVATGRNARPAVDVYFEKENFTNLPKLFDPKMALARDFGATALPVSVLIGPDGREIARASGAVDWASPAAIKLFQTWMAD
ncbi:thioredoxin [Litoreibacter roseus]|uniref:Thioredoxin n=2 Tax=Litoreibacter roseus TaxID=2601869 RepID=A0A6N6JFB2_9RHOB|nr:thioredoxin [Litoreibacter roseus]